MDLIKILIAEDHELTRKGWVDVLNRLNNCKVIGEASDGNELVDKYFKLNPDIILVDISMPGKTGTRAVREIKNKDADVKALFFSASFDESDVYMVYEAGGTGFADKAIAAADLNGYIQKVFKGELAFGPNWNEAELKKLLNKFKNSVFSLFDNIEDILTNREMEIFEAIGKKLNNQEISDTLNISINTIQNHRFNIMRKLKIKSYEELLAVTAEYFKKVLKNK